MLTFNNIKNKNTKFPTIYNSSYKYGFSSQEVNKKYYYQINKINKVLSPINNYKIYQGYLSINVDDILYKKDNYFKNINVDFIDKESNKEYVFTQDLFSYISQQMEQRKTISINVGLNNYIYDKQEKSYSTHSILIILHPIKNKKSKHINYNMFWFNSHGRSLYYTNFHIKQLSSKRFKKVNLSKPIDFIIAERFVESFNTFKTKNKIKNQTIHYEPNDKHNYLGLNLQLYDNHGCCFIFPILFNLILHTNYNKYFINTHNDNIKMESTVCSLLEEKNVELFVYHCLGEIDDRIHNPIIQYYKTKDEYKLDEDLDSHLDKYKEKIIKKVLIKTMGFIKQSYWSIALFNIKN